VAALKTLDFKYAWLQLMASEHGPPNPCTRLVLFGLSLHMKKNGDDCFPSQARIARQTGLSERAVRDNLKRAVSDGWLALGTRPREGNKPGFVYNVYTPKLPEIAVRQVRRQPGVKVKSWIKQAASGAGCVVADKAAPADGCTADSLPESEHPAAPSLASGATLQSTRQQAPPNLSGNLSSNTPETEPPHSGSLGRVVRKIIQKSEKSPESEMQIRAKISKARAIFPHDSDEAIARMTGVPVDVLQRLQ
jgi:hypothetical protein